jgi:hypothetical protein
MREVMRHILRFIADINPDYKIYYTRRWTDDSGNLWFDVGSHTEFFILKGDIPEDEQETQKINTSPTEAERKRLYYRPE